jgi:hypothetical protein
MFQLEILAVIPVFSSGLNAKRFPHGIRNHDREVSSGQTAFNSAATLIGSVLIGSERGRQQTMGFHTSVHICLQITFLYISAFV